MIEESELVNVRKSAGRKNHTDMLHSRVTFYFDELEFKRRVSGREVILHCHHYNARMQGTIESATLIDGKEIIRSSAESVFLDYFNHLFDPNDSLVFKWDLVGYLYAYLGYGTIDCSHVTEGYFVSGSSHFVEGWINGFEKRTDNVCTFTEGYLQGAYFAITGTAARINEVHCQVNKSQHCRFEISFSQNPPQIPPKEIPLTAAHGAHREDDLLKSSNINEGKILDAMKQMPFRGNKQGLIPLFNVYLANVPADFYNLISVRFIEEMEKCQMGEAARKLLVCCGEICALHTFRGVMNSAEWDGLVQPMIRDTRDKLFALVTISNGFGWGNWRVKKFIESEFLAMESFNGYESLGYRAMRPVSTDPKCFMFTGVSAGLMELLYSEGSLDDRFGTFVGCETQCTCCGSASCQFEASTVLPDY